MIAATSGAGATGRAARLRGERHVRAPLGINVGGILFARSGFPYTGVVGIDADGDGFSSNGSYGDRPAA